MAKIFIHLRDMKERKIKMYFVNHLLFFKFNFPGFSSPHQTCHEQNQRKTRAHCTLYQHNWSKVVEIWSQVLYTSLFNKWNSSHWRKTYEHYTPLATTPIFFPYLQCCGTEMAFKVSWGAINITIYKSLGQGRFMIFVGPRHSWIWIRANVGGVTHFALSPFL